MPLAGREILESFIDHIEKDGIKRRHWLSRVREAGFDQALSEYSAIKRNNEETSKPQRTNEEGDPNRKRMYQPYESM